MKAKVISILLLFSLLFYFKSIQKKNKLVKLVRFIPGIRAN